MQTSYSRFRFPILILISCVVGLASGGTARAWWWCDNGFHKCVPSCGCAGGCTTCKLGQASVPQISTDQTSIAPVRYFDGDIRMVTDDMSGGASSASLWGHTRIYTNQLPSDISEPNGAHWLVRQWPLAKIDGPNTVTIIFDPLEAFWFDLSGGVYVARYGAKQTLVDDTANGVFRMTYPDGTFWEFYDLTQTAFPKGQFKRRVTPGGDTAQVSGSVGSQITQLTLSHSVSGATYEQYDYSYGTAGGGNGQLASVQLSRLSVGGGSLAPVRNVNYSYYTTGSGTNGLSGDLKLVECQTPSGGGWTDAEVYYYRYYLDNSTGQGFAHGLRRAFFPAGSQALIALAGGISNLDSLSDSAVAPYSCLYFQYDSLQRVTFESTCGGAAQLSYSYTPGAQGTDYNVWAQKTTESLLGSGGTSTIYTKTVYSNFVGQVLLTDVFDTTPGASGHWIGYWRYDGNGHQVLAAEPSAVSGYTQISGNWNQSTPVTFTSTGLVHETTYYPTTTAGETTPGGEATYPAYELVRQAGSNSSSVFSGTVSLPLSGGTSAVLSYTQYFAHSGVLSIGGTVSSPTGGTQTIFPMAVQTTYSDPAGSGTSAITTSNSYAWYPVSGGAQATLQVQQVTTVLPPVPATQNGAPNASSGTAAASAWVVFPRLQYSNSTGDVTWSQDERGRLTFNNFDQSTGLLTETVMDVSGTGSTGLGLPSGWNAPGDGLNVISDFQYDGLGRSVQTLGPAHVSDLGQNVRTAGWTVYDDANHIVRSAQGYVMVSGGSTNLVNPVSIQIYDPERRLLQSISATRGGNVVLSSGSLATTDTFAQSSYVRWSINHYTARRLDMTANYFLVSTAGTVANAFGFFGSAGTLGASGASVGNYNVTQFGYQTYGSSAGTTGLMGQQNKTQSPGGTISRTVLDVRGQPAGTWIGTNDTGAIDTDPTGGSAAGNNMVQVSGGTWNVDSTLAQSAAFVSATASRTTLFSYDWRDRRYSTETFGGLNMSGTSFFTQVVLDNLGRATETDGYANGTGTANLIGKRTASFDPLSRAYQQQTFSVDITSGTVGNALTASTWFDAAGNVRMSKMAGSGTNTFTKTVFDGLGRSASSYSGYTPSGGTLTQVPTLVGSADVVFQQSETAYDPASNAIFMTSRSRLATSGTATGGLDASSGSLARSSYSAVWQDGIGRTTATADFGINGGTAMTVANRQTTAPLTTSSSTLMLVSATVFNARGEAFQTIDPKSRVDQVQFDDAGRTLSTVQNYMSGGTAADQNITVQTAYTMDGQVATLNATNGTVSQITQYAFGTSAGTADSGVARSDLLKGVIYPDSTNSFTMSGGSTANGFPISGTPTFTGTGALYDRVQYTYNRLGEQATMRDQNSTVHAYALDGLGRPIADSITLSGSGVDTSVLQIARSYEVRGMLQHVLSYSNSGGTGTPFNDVLMVYNGFGQLASEYQEHTGAVVTSGTATSLSVQYAYGSGTANTIRPTSVTYPNGRSISYGYNLGTDDNLSRLSNLASSGGSLSSGTLSQFSYLGLSQIVTEQYPLPGVSLDYSGGTAANYPGFDNFDRIRQQTWLGSSGTLDQFNYGYDLAGNRLSRQNAVTTLKDEQYSYDGVYRVLQSSRGSLTTSGTISGTPVRQEGWTLDQTGNWSTFTQSNTGTLALSQTRTHNAANELTTISGTGAFSLTFDQAGNSTTIPISPSGGPQVFCSYDAWNRLTGLAVGSPHLATFSYDGLGRRTKKFTNFSGFPPAATAVTHYYLAGQQVVETRTGSPASSPQSLAPSFQYAWSPRYIDAPILRDDFTTGGTANAHLYYLNDANFNVTSLVGTNGSVVERCVYDAYGTPTFFNATWSTSSASTSSSVGNTTLYTGRELDPETGLYYYRARYYSPGLGRFVGRDPIGYDGGVNFYEYVGGIPTETTDPAGLGPPSWGRKGNRAIAQSWLRFLDSLFGTTTASDQQIPPEQKRPPYTIPPEFFNKAGCCQLQVTMFCRQMPAEAELTGTHVLRHCYLAIKIAGTDKWIDTLSGQQNGLKPNMLVRTDPRDMAFDYGHLLNGTGGEKILSFSIDGNQCDFWKCAQDEATQFSNTTHYNQYFNNSNTFLSHLVEKCHGRVIFPVNAIASRNIGYPWWASYSEPNQRIRAPINWF